MKTWIETCFGISMIFLTSGCATLVTQVNNDPDKTLPNGERVNIFVTQVLDQGGPEDISNSIAGKTLILNASEWLRKQGYQVQSGMSSRVDSTVRFVLQASAHTEYVPGQTYSTPIYGNSGTTSTVTNAYGATVGTIQTQASNPYAPTSYQSNYVEGHNQTVMDRYLHIYVDAWARGAPPVTISQGEVFPEKRNQKFFEDPMVMKSAVEKALTASVLGTTRSVPAHTEDQPGCWPRLGINFDQTEKIIKGSRIKSFSKISLASSLGLEIGDIVDSIDGHALPYKNTPKLQEGVEVPVMVEKDGRVKTVFLKAIMMCVDDS